MHGQDSVSIVSVQLEYGLNQAVAYTTQITTSNL